MVVDGPICALYDAVDPGTMTARLRALDDFGVHALLTHHPVKETTMSNEEKYEFRGPLRELAKALGKLPVGIESFRKNYKDLVDILRSDFPQIESLSIQQISDLLAEVKKGGGTSSAAPVTQAIPVASAVAAPAPGAVPVKRGPGRPPKVPRAAEPQVAPEEIPAPVEAPPEAAPIEAAPAEGGPRKPRLPVRRPMVGVAAPVETLHAEMGAAPGVPTQTTAVVDLLPMLTEMADLRKRIDMIGSIADASAGEIKKLRGDMIDLTAKTTAIVNALTFLYNHLSGDDADSIENVDWGQG